MKFLKIISLALILIIVFMPERAAAQTPDSAMRDVKKITFRNEFAVGYGIPTTSDLLFPLLKMMGTVATLGGYTEKNLKMYGGLHAAYKYRFDKVASLGATFVYGRFDGDVWWSGDYWGKSQSNHYSFAIECDLRYMTRPAVSFYSTIGLAATYSTTDFRSADPRDQQLSSICYVLPNMHVTLLGIKAGSERVGGFAELGVGYKGILNCGVYVRF